MQIDLQRAEAEKTKKKRPKQSNKLITYIKAYSDGAQEIRIWSLNEGVTLRLCGLHIQDTCLP